ncbi:MAG: FoF1 ATP synthase subunit a [Chloroflexota bacterium]|nr:FoF1 ATP synthase subunit a [Chloroflexota bacterium]
MSGKKVVVIVAIIILLIAANFFTPFTVNRISVELKPERLFEVGPLAVTNTLLSSWLTVIILVIFALLSCRHLVDTPAPLSMQNVMEMMVEAAYDLLEQFAGAHTRAFFTVSATFLLYIVVANWLPLLPGFGSVGIFAQRDGRRAFIPLLRGSTTDLNTTTALAICSVVSSQVYAVRFAGFFNHLLHYIAIDNFLAFGKLIAKGKGLKLGLLLQGFLDLFIGLLNIFEELTKVLSFSFRLFGNVFGGEVLLTVMAFLAPYVVSVPFMMMELFTGFIQALIFALLSTAFFAQAVPNHGQTIGARDSAPSQQTAETEKQ